jgi:hypothetical protein
MVICSRFCDEHDLVIEGTVFPHQKCHKILWVSPDQNSEIQIDHIAISRKFRCSLCIVNVRNKRGADVGSDHQLMQATFQLKIISATTKFDEKRKRLDIMQGHRGER